GWGDFEDGWYLHPMVDSATDPNKWAYIDICSPWLESGYPAGSSQIPTTLESYIQFNDIDLSNVPNPKLMWSQLFRPFNPHWVKLYVDASVDGTTWTSYEVNQNISHGEYADYYQSLLIPVVANEPNAFIRFRWTHDKSSNPDYPVGMGWGIDDVMFIEAPQYDLKHLETAMNFFVYVDYHVAAQSNGYHYSGHFGQIPKEQMETDYSFMFFNTIVENKGLAEVTPEIKVKVTGPDGTEVYTNTIAGTAIASGAVDTIDIMEPEFVLDIPVTLGEYLVTVDVAVKGQEDANTNDNSYETKFFVTGGTYARDLDNITQGITLANYNIGGVDEEMVATNYYMNKSTNIKSVDVFVGATTTVGNTIQVELMKWGAEKPETFAQSEPLIIAEEHLDTWVNFTFADNTDVNVDLVNEGNYDILAGVKHFYTASDVPAGQTSTISIGMDKTTNFGSWSGWFKILDSGEWKWYYGATDGKALGVRLNLPYENYVKEDMLANFKVYPNPTQDILKIETQSQKSILNIYSVDGKLVRNIEVSNNAEINVSEFATGVYTVVLTDENGNVGTQRFIKN
ncbi:MAG: T9SS type A sorting domain-containing protein, partial [Bacteroidales bacterium]